MRGKACRVEHSALRDFLQLGREVAQTSVWMGLTLVVVLCAYATPWRGGNARATFIPTREWLNSEAAAQTPPRKNAGLGPSFKGPLGLQLYSLRNEFKRDGVAATLARVRALGFRYVEGGGTYGLTPQAFKAELDQAGLQMVSIMAGYDTLRDKISDVIADAKLYGAQYVGTAWIPHERPFSEAKAREAVIVFNQAGATCKAAGLKFFYHLHGYEFQPAAAGTLFDVLLKGCKPTLVNFELDVFWATHGGQDAARMLQQHPTRFLLTHLKDLRKDVAGDLTGSAPDDTSVVLGTGKVDWPAVLRAAKQARVQWYFIEAEELEAAQNIPQSLDYLERVRF